MSFLIFFFAFEGEDGDTKELSVAILPIGVEAEFANFDSSDVDDANPVNADSDVEETMAPSDVTFFKTFVAVDETPAAASASSAEREDSSLFSLPPMEEAEFFGVPFPSLDKMSASLPLFAPLSGRAQRYGGIKTVFESSK